MGPSWPALLAPQLALPLSVLLGGVLRARIEERAKATGLSISAYLRTAGLGHPIESVLDHAAVMDLAKVNGDQGRLGGLLKWWLMDRPGRGAARNRGAPPAGAHR
jgi:hypothetical protein